MQSEDQVAASLVHWEEALAANQPPPALDQLRPGLRPRAREGLQLLRGFAWRSRGLSTTPPVHAPQAPPDTRRYRVRRFNSPVLLKGGSGPVRLAHRRDHAP